VNTIVSQSMKRYQVLVAELELPLHTQMMSEHIKKFQADILSFFKDIRIYMRYKLIDKKSKI